jgi:signal transduction histidine kinase
MVAVAVGMLAFTGLATLALARRNADAAAERDLGEKASVVAPRLERLGRLLRTNTTTQPTLKRLIDAVLAVSGGAIVTITPDGRVQEGIVALAAGECRAGRGTATPVAELPTGVRAADLDPVTLRSGRQQSGQRGRLVFVAQPLTTTACGTPVLVVSQRIETNLGRAGVFFLFVSGIATLVAMAMAFYLARRLTRPLALMDATTRKIASGDLSARVDLGRHPPDELSELASTLNAMAAQLETARGQERAFLLSVSHDLRTPLTSIKGYAEAITDGTVQSVEDRLKAAGVIAAESRRLERLVADLLDLARLDAHEFSLRPRPVDAVAAVTEAVGAFRPSAEDLGITLRVDAPVAVLADADPERLGQIVANLVENALKYATASIVVRVTATPGALELRVEDDGPGIDPRDLPQVFDRLYASRTAPGRKVGTGLGLAIVRELAAAMGGNASVERADGGGTCFVVRLPVLARVAPA